MVMPVTTTASSHFDWNAFVGVAIGAALGLTGIVVGWLNSRGERRQTAKTAKEQREHERTLARENRIHDRVAEAYEDLLRFAYHLSHIVDGTFPTGSGVVNVPDPISPEELVALIARVGTVSSENVQASMNLVVDRYYAYTGRYAALPAATADPAEANRRLEPLVTEFNAAVEALRIAVASEVRGDSPTELE